IQPWSVAYLSKAATPANRTSMPTLTGTLPSVNQRCTQRTSRVTGSGPLGGAAARGTRDPGAALAAVAVVVAVGVGVGTGIGATGCVGVPISDARGVGAAAGTSRAAAGASRS